MADVLVSLGKLNLAMSAAIIAVYLLRRPLRAQFGAAIAYAIWLLVPIAGLASLLPPRVIAPSPPQLLPAQYPAVSMSAPEQVHQALFASVVAARNVIADYQPPEYWLLLFVVWVLGVALMALYLAGLQARFHATLRSGAAGPAILGFLRPRLVVPDAFEAQFTASERAAILAHEQVHLARQDARVNAFAALLRCLCWFNPLIHLGAASLRMDQEFACDATALTGPVSRRDYAKALLKSQMMMSALPLGCNWPGAQHPLIERVLLLRRKPPGVARRIAGMGVVVLVAAFAGLGAWAAQPPVLATPITDQRLGGPVALAEPSGANQAMDQKAQSNVAPAADAIPAANRDDPATPGKANVVSRIAAPPSPRRVLVSASAGLERAPILHEITAQIPEIITSVPALTTMVALADPPPGPDLTAAADQGQANTPMGKPWAGSQCNNTMAYARVISPEAVQMQGFTCLQGASHGDETRGYAFRLGVCPAASTWPRSPTNPELNKISRAGDPCPFDVTMNVALADPADAAKMQSGKMIRLAGKFRITYEQGLDYLSVTNAKIIWVDPFGT